MSYTINNIKVSFKIEAISLDIVQKQLISNKISFRIYHNYYVFKIESYHCVMFKANQVLQNNHLNVTKIKSIENIEEIKKLVEKIFKRKVIHSNIDNIMATSMMSHPLLLQNLAQNQLRNIAKFNIETFPGLFLKYKEGTIILFHSGKIVIVGCRCEEDIKCLLLRTFASMMK